MKKGMRGEGTKAQEEHVGPRVRQSCSLGCSSFFGEGRGERERVRVGEGQREREDLFPFFFERKNLKLRGHGARGSISQPWVHDLS